MSYGTKNPADKGEVTSRPQATSVDELSLTPISADTSDITSIHNKLRAKESAENVLRPDMVEAINDAFEEARTALQKLL